MKSYCNVTLAEFASEASQGRHFYAYSITSEVLYLVRMFCVNSASAECRATTLVTMILIRSYVIAELQLDLMENSGHRET